jgi:hypothetical protein
VEGSVELARQHWAEGHRRLVRTKDPEPRLHARMLEQIDVVIAELRARVGKTFTLSELAAAYGGADIWAHEAVEDHAESPDWMSTASVATDAAFHLYSHGARDYRP